MLPFPGTDYGNPDPNPEWMRVDWRQHLRRVDLPGAEAVNYVEIGEGEPIVFIHGIGGCWQNWLENLPYFARTHRVIALDLPGFGASPMPSWDISMAAYGRFMHDFCERLGIGNVAALVGNSMGGFIATEATVERPDRFERLVLVSAAGISFSEIVGLRAKVIEMTMAAVRPFMIGDRQVWLSRPGGRQFAFGRVMRAPAKLRPELLKEQTTPGLNAPGFMQALVSVGGYDTRSRLTEIEIPTMVVWGLNDKVVPVEAALGYHRLIPESRLELFERTGHVPQLERPARFNALVEDFVESSQPLRAAADTAIS